MKKALIALSFLAAAASAAFAQLTVSLTPMPAGAMSRIGWYVPQQATVSPLKPPAVKKAPQGLVHPLYGIFPMAKAIAFVFDDSGALYVDSNGDGDLTNDPAAVWTPYTNTEGYTQYSGGAVITLRSGARTTDVRLAMYRFDESDPARAAFSGVLFYYRDYASVGELPLGDARYPIILSDEKASGDYRSRDVQLLMDLNGDGRITSPRESFDPSKPFNIGGTTWEIKDIDPLGASFTLVKSSRTVAETLPPPDLRVGKPAVSFTAKDIDGKQVKFPTDFPGRIVMLDFWATWCGPCMDEVPGLAAAYLKYHARGFEILGISLDSAANNAKMRSTMKANGMTWRQICDGKEWSAELALLYVVTGIPAAYLVDGTTGEILAAGSQLRGSALETTLERVLGAKGL